MPNLFDYLSWRGICPLRRPLQRCGQPHSLRICAMSVWTAWSPHPANRERDGGPGGGAPLRRPHRTLPDAGTRDFDQRNLLLLDALSRTPRFMDLPLSGYVSRHDHRRRGAVRRPGRGFGGGEGYLAFRGTDSSLVGWKEDFNMAFLPFIPSQRSAAEYLAQVGKGFRRLRLGGPPKGGNLAVYAATRCGRAVQRRLLAVYNNDGPGFHTDVLSCPEYLSVRNRVHTFVPQSSVVGMLLDHEESYTVVHSTQTGLLQHDPYSWQVLGPGFVCLDTVTGGSKFFSLTMKRWVAAMEPTVRETFVDALFDVLGATNAGTLEELSERWWESAGAVLAALKDLDDETRRASRRPSAFWWTRPGRPCRSSCPNPRPCPAWVSAPRPHTDIPPGPAEWPPPPAGGGHWALRNAAAGAALNALHPASRAKRILTPNHPRAKNTRTALPSACFCLL